MQCRQRWLVGALLNASCRSLLNSEQVQARLSRPPSDRPTAAPGKRHFCGLFAARGAKNEGDLPERLTTSSLLSIFRKRRQEATRLCSAALLLPSSSSLRSDSGGGGGVQSDKFSSNPLSLSLSAVRSSFLRPQPCGRLTLGRDVGGEPVLGDFFAREFSVKIRAKKWASERASRACRDQIRRDEEICRCRRPKAGKNAKPGEMGRKFPETPPRIRKNKKRHEILPSSK